MATEVNRKNWTHGTASTYRRPNGCRCKACRLANTERTRDERASRKARLDEMFDQLPHGSSSTYSNWGCRCTECSSAWSQKCKDQAARRRAIA